MHKNIKLAKVNGLMQRYFVSGCNPGKEEQHAST
jgi:hypothetical protein